jgi:hypothetical protein
MPRQDRTTIDCGALYERKRCELLALVASAGTGALDELVMATPAWTVRGVLAHVVGLAADLNAQRFPAPDDVDGTGWTAAQVTRRRNATLDDLASEWDREAARFEEGLQLFGYELGSHYVGDLFNHAQDVRATLHAGRDDDRIAIGVSLDHYLGFLDGVLHEQSIGRLDLTFGTERRVVGEGAPGASRASLDAAPFELLRAVSGRRSTAQLRALAWTGDAEAFLPFLSAYGIPETDLVE